MEYIIELLVELLLDGTFELSQTKKTPNWLRYPLIGIVLFIFIGTIGVILLTGYLALKEIKIVGIILIALGISLLIYCPYKFKHLYIKRNPNSKETKLINKFIEQICPKKINDLTDIQKKAVFCFLYDREINIGGHVAYFDNYEKISNEEMIEALKIVSSKKFVNNFKEAMENGKEDNYKKADLYYKELSPCLTEYIEEYILNNKEEIFKDKLF